MQHYQLHSILLAAAAMVGTGACNSLPAYYDGFERLEISASSLDPLTAHPVVGNFVQTEYWLDYQAPTAEELAELQPAGSEPVDQVPWIRRNDLEVSVQYRLENKTEGPLTAWVTLDGASEFFDWNPIELFGIAGGEDADEIPFPSLLGLTPIHLEGGEVLTGEFREDDVVEAAYDLDVMTRFCGGPFAVLYNRSEVDPVGTDGVPPGSEIAGFGMIRLTLGADGPAVLDYSLRIRDAAGRLYDAREDYARYEFTPIEYVPLGLAQAVPADQIDPGVISEFCLAQQDPPA